MTCENCNKRPTCKEICKELEKQLPALQKGKNGKKENIYPLDKLEEIANKRAFYLKYGNRKLPSSDEY